MPDLEDKIIRNGTLISMFFLCLGFVYKGLLAVLTNRKSVKELKAEVDDLKDENAALKEKLNNHTIAIEKLNDRIYELKK